MHLWVIRRKAISPRIAGDVGDAERLPLPDDEAQEAVPARQRADHLSFAWCQPAGDEALDHPVGVRDAERRVFGIGELSHPVHDQLQDGLERQDARDPLDGDVKRREVRLCPARAPLPAVVGFRHDGSLAAVCDAMCR